MTDDKTIEKNKAIVRRMLEAFNTGDTKVVADLFHKNIKDTGSKVGFEKELQEAHPIKRVQTEIMREEDAFPDRKFKEDAIIAEGDTVMLRWSMTGTHKGEILGRPATGKKVKTSGTEIVRIKDGKIVEHVGDDTPHVIDLLMQLDLLDKDVQKMLRSGDKALAKGFRTAR